MRSAKRSLRGALKRLFKTGYKTLTLDLLMRKLGEMNGLAKGLARPDTVVCALRWVAEHA